MTGVGDYERPEDAAQAEQVGPAARLPARVGAELAVVWVDAAVGAYQLAGQDLLLAQVVNAAGSANERDRRMPVGEVLQ